MFKSLSCQSACLTLLLHYFKKKNIFLVYAICFYETVGDKWCLHKTVQETENGLERGFAKHWPNFV